MVDNVLLLENINIIIGRLIEKHRTLCRLRQSDVASRCGLSRTYLSDVERGLRNLSVGSLYRIAMALNVRPSEILVQVEDRVEKNNITKSGSSDGSFPL